MKFGETLIYGVISLFGIAVIYVLMFETAINNFVVPAFKNLINDPTIGIQNTTTRLEVLNNYSNIIFSIKTLLFALFVIVIIFLFVTAFRKEQEQEQYMG